jgi:integrase
VTSHLTTAAVQKLKPAAQPRMIRDAGARSLYLVITPSGHRSWLMRFRRPGGKPGKIVLGPVDLSGRELSGDPVIGMPLTLVGARQLAAQVHRERALGHDPVADHKSRKQRQRAAVEDRAANSFATLLRRFADEHARVRTRRWRYTLRQLGLAYPKNGSGDPIETRGGLTQRWGDKPVREIAGHDVYSVVDEARRIGTPGIGVRKHGVSEARARDLHSALSSMFGWLHRHRLVEANPAANVFRPPSSPARDRVLTPDETRRFWLACDVVPEPFGRVFKLLLLLGSRLSEIAGMRHDELRDDGSWHLPGSRTKNHRALVTMLPPLAREIIAATKRIEGCPFVFSTTGHSPISGWTKIKRALDKAMGNPSPPFRLHDLRRTAVTGMGELGIRTDVIELVVNHVSGSRGAIAGVYNRSQLLEERREALERWAKHVQGLVTDETDKVVSLPRRRRR